jgi:hypothetical protein
MPVTVHPRLFSTRGLLEEQSTPPGEQIRVLVYTPGSGHAPWIESELAHKTVLVQIGYSVGQVVSALTEDPPPRPQILVVDLDQVPPGDVLHLHVAREQGWFGRIIAIGAMPVELRVSLVVDCVIGPPFVRNTLRDVVASSNFVAATTKLPVL